MRLLKQFMYGGIFLFIIALIVWWLVGLVYTPNPTCFDNSKNQGEEGVDCGGPCFSCAIKSLIPITIQNKYVIPVGSEVGVVIELVNKNIGWAVKTFDYTLTLKDQFGAPIQTISGSSFIYGGELKNIVVPLVSVNSEIVASVDMTIENPLWIQSDTLRKPSIEIQDTGTIYDQGIVVQAKINNKDAQSFINAQVIALVFNRAGTLIGASKTRIDSLPTFESKQVRVLFSKDLSLYQPIISPNITFSHTINPGDTGGDVQNLQNILSEQGIYTGTVTGFFDEDTQTALKTFQEKNKLETTGIFNEETRIFINSLLVSETPQQNTQTKDTSVDASRTKVFVEASR